MEFWVEKSPINKYFLYYCIIIYKLYKVQLKDVHNLPYLLIYWHISCFISCVHQYYLRAKLAGSRGKSQPARYIPSSILLSVSLKTFWTISIYIKIYKMLLFINKFSRPTHRLYKGYMLCTLVLKYYITILYYDTPSYCYYFFLRKTASRSFCRK